MTAEGGVGAVALLGQVLRTVLPFIKPGPGTARPVKVSFFGTSAMRRKAGSLSDALRNGSTVKMLLVGGTGLLPAQVAQKITVALLPDPDSPSLIHYAQTVRDPAAGIVNDSSGLPRKILESTKYLLESGIDVGWYPQFIGITLMIVDPGHTKGWVQSEIVLPFISQDDRTCTVVRNSASPGLTAIANATFDKMYASAPKPTLAVVQARLNAKVNDAA
jgi:hypothetical protein